MKKTKREKIIFSLIVLFFATIIFYGGGWTIAGTIKFLLECIVGLAVAALVCIPLAYLLISIEEWAKRGSK